MWKFEKVFSLSHIPKSSPSLSHQSIPTYHFPLSLYIATNPITHTHTPNHPNIERTHFSTGNDTLFLQNFWKVTTNQLCRYRIAWRRNWHNTSVLTPPTPPLPPPLSTTSSLPFTTSSSRKLKTRERESGRD